MSEIETGEPVPLIIIPCRAGSKRLHGKNKMLLGGKPLFTYAVDDALACWKAGSIAVSTDDPDIIQEAERRYEKKIYVIRRDPRYATDTSPIQEAIDHCARCIDLASIRFTGLMWLQANVLNRPKGVIGKCMDLFRSTNVDSVVTVKETDYNPFWTYQIKDGRLHYPWERSRWQIVRDRFPFRRQEQPKYYVLDGGVIVVKRKLVERKSGLHPYLGESTIPVICPNYTNMDIDTESDYQMIESMIKGGFTIEPSG